MDKVSFNSIYRDKIIPKTVTADAAATVRAILLFLSFFFSAFILESKSVNFTLFTGDFSSGIL